MDNQEEVDKSLETHSIPKLNQEKVRQERQQARLGKGSIEPYNDKTDFGFHCEMGALGRFDQ